MNYKLELQKIELQLKTITAVEDKINLLKQAIKIADLNNDIEWAFDLRLDLIAEEVSTSKCIDSFAAFAWLLDIRDKNPELFDESEFLWEYKWMSYASYRNVNISKKQIESILEDLKARMIRNGYSLRGYYSVLISWNQFLGKIEEVEHYIELREKEERDEMSHCPACELDTKVEVELQKGNFDEAITMSHDLVTKKLTCAHMPFATLCQLSYYLNKAEDERAEIYFDKALIELQEVDKEDSSIVAIVSLLINYLIDKDKNKAFSFFEQYALWELEAEDSIKYTFSKNILRLFIGEESKNLFLPLKHPLYKQAQQYKLSELYTYYYNQTLDLAQRFDKRNETFTFVNSLNKEIKSI